MPKIAVYGRYIGAVASFLKERGSSLGWTREPREAYADGQPRAKFRGVCRSERA